MSHLPFSSGHARTSLLRRILVLALLAIAPAAHAQDLRALQQSTHFHGLAFNRAGTALLLLATHHGIFAVTAEGEARLVSDANDFMGFSVDPSDPLGYWASGHPAGGGNSGLLHSRTGGASWNKVSDGLNGPVDFHQLDVSRVDPATIFGSFRGLQVSRDAGLTWQLTGALPEATIGISASALSAERLFAATETGLMVSDDLGATWRVAGFEGEVVTTVRSGTGGVLYAFVLDRGLMRGDEADATGWTGIAGGFGASVPLHFAIDASDPDRLAFASHDGKVFLSEDAGVSWRDLAMTGQ